MFFTMVCTRFDSIPNLCSQSDGGHLMPMEGTSCQWKVFADEFKHCTYHKSATSDFANCNKLQSDLETVFAVYSS